MTAWIKTRTLDVLAVLGIAGFIGVGVFVLVLLAAMPR